MALFEGADQKTGGIDSHGPRAVPRSNVAAIALIIGLLCTAGVIGIALYATQLNRSVREDIAAEREAATKRVESESNRLTRLEVQLVLTQERVGLTQQEIERAQHVSAQLKSQQEGAVRSLASQISRKAEVREVEALKNATTGQIGEVLQTVGGVIQQVDTTREDLGRTQKDLANLKSEHGQLIALNSDGLAELRRRGERQYYEFDIAKKDKTKRVGDISIELRKTDTKNQKVDLRVHINDLKVEKKGVYANEPIRFKHEKEGSDYEVVVNRVFKDQIRGYLSVPLRKTTGSAKPGQ